MTKIKILIIGPQRSGKTTIANILGELQEGPTSIYRPTVGCRIIELSRDPPPSVSGVGKLEIEFWDVSGDMKYEKCWGPIQKDAHGIIFVYDPAAPQGEDLLNKFVSLFPRQMNMQPKFCMAYVNHHNVGVGNQTPNAQMSSGLDFLDKTQGTAEDTSFVYQGFEKYLIKLLKLMGQ